MYWINCNFNLHSSLKLLQLQTIIPFKNIDEFLDYSFASLQGGFDPKLADEKELEQFKQKYGDNPFQYDLFHVLFMILQK